MQLHFETDELNLLANLLLQKSGAPYEDLVEMVMARDLSFDSDELEAVADLVAAEMRVLKENILREPDGSRNFRMQANLAMLERLQERVNEACVMI